ncbi:MAG: hypothetical protein IJ017_06595 [Oscillospiraceae bacterium]|nr:hypothetical protein [Oscillospiraceae bacterium]
MEQYFKISEYDDCYILRCDNGARQDIFDKCETPSTGPIIESVVMKIAEVREFEEFPLELDSDSNMFCAYSQDRRSLREFCDLLNEVFANDDELEEIISSEDVQETRRIEESLASLTLDTPELLSKMGFDPSKELDPEDISNILGSLFN